MPAEVRNMPAPDALALLEYWQDAPPLHEIVSVYVGASTTWKPESRRTLTAEDQQRSLEARWNAGALNVKQLFDAMGGAINFDGSRGGFDPKRPPGFGPFPGNTVH